MSSALHASVHWTCTADVNIFQLIKLLYTLLSLELPCLSAFLMKLWDQAESGDMTSDLVRLQYFRL